MTSCVRRSGWSWTNARRQLTAARKRKGHAASVKRKQRVPTYGYDTVKVLQLVWSLVGEPCGKYLAPIMATMLPALKDFGDLKPVAFRLSPAVREQLQAMSPATIDRLLKPFKAATRLGSRLRSTIQVRQAMNEMEKRPRFFEIDLVAHCGHSLKGGHAWTLTATDVFTGWTENVAIRNRAFKWAVGAVTEIADRLPYPMEAQR